MFLQLFTVEVDEMKDNRTMINPIFKIKACNFKACHHWK